MRLPNEFESFRALRNKTKQSIRNVELRYSHDLFQSFKSTMCRLCIHSTAIQASSDVVILLDDLNSMFFAVATLIPK